MYVDVSLTTTELLFFIISLSLHCTKYIYMLGKCKCAINDNSLEKKLRPYFLSKGLYFRFYMELFIKADV